MPGGVAFVTACPTHAFLHSNPKSDQKHLVSGLIYLLTMTGSLDIYYY